MASSYPDDMFDAVPDELQRVGAHRAPVARRSGWWAFGWAAASTGALFIVGALVFTLATGGFDFGGGTTSAISTPEPTSSVKPITDPSTIPASRKITITVLNGTATTDLDKTAQKALSKAGWPVGATADADSRDYTTTTVFYTDAADEDVALGVSAALGVGGAQYTDAQLGAPITVVLGTDYADAESAG